MNKRIRQLAEQAGITTNIDTDYFERDMNKWVDYFSEKFAELIVAECAEQSMSIGRYNTPSNITPDLSIAIAVGLKKHFGVEE